VLCSVVLLLGVLCFYPPVGGEFICELESAF
jgi:hypothetical protein